MSTRAAAANLGMAVKELAVHWEETKAHWRDVKRQEFEREYLDVLPDHVARATSVMEEIDTLLRKVRSDCE